MQPVVDPVVTQCGHLYCWPCLHRWLKVQRDTYTCPVCKAGVERTKVSGVDGMRWMWTMIEMGLQV